MFAEVVVNVAHLSGTFDYSIPAALRGVLACGHLVTVPFGARRAQGIVVGLPESSPVSAPKAIEGLVDAEPVLTRAQIDLAYWLAHTYLASVNECLTLMLPPGLSKRSDVRYTLEQPVVPEKADQQALVDLLKARGPLRGRQIDRSLPDSAWRRAADSLVRQGVVSRQSVLEPPTLHAKQVRTARIAAPFAQIEAAKPGLSPRSPAKAARLAKVLDFLVDELEPVDVSWVYAETGADFQDLKTLAEKGLVELGEAEVWRDSLAGQVFVPVEPPELTSDQAEICETIVQRIRRPQIEPPAGETYLLHGVTGSGKTEIYLRALEAALAQGQRAIVLVPEIALTPQTIRRFASRFPGKVAVWHSELSEGERYDTWRRARAGEVGVVVGARSALFAPLPNLGLIVLDEEHDPAYKQDRVAAVAYHARDAAVEYARRLGAVCVLGSATPDVVSYYRAKQGTYRLLELPERIMGHVRYIQEQASKLHVEPAYHALANGPSDAQTIDLPPVEMVDLRQELRAGNTSIFSRRLQKALGEVLARGEQAILFLNRRGTATFVFCRDCGEAVKCPNCDMPLTQHLAGGAVAKAVSGRLVCHHCGFTRPQPEICPQCGSKRIRFFGTGTEKVEETLRALLPQARPLRWDRDVTRTKGAHDLILRQFSAHEADVLIGTQMIAKGLDLPLVTLVGVISADVGLGLPDYRAPERTFQILTQVAGRAGRGLLGGRVVLQTYQPEHYVLQAAAKHDYAEFFVRELRHRKELGYPPFRRVMRLVYRHAENGRAESEANIVAQQMKLRLKDGKFPATEIVGPTPCFFEKIAGDYRWQIIIRSPDPAVLARDLPLKGWVVDVDPESLL
jgi:primosomal protein N' (replication factor Y) (superfamily II helicase)